METWAYFKSYFRPMIRVKLRTQFQQKQADELTELVLKILLEKFEQGEPRDPTRLAEYVSEVCEDTARRAVQGSNLALRASP
jgi:tRNA A37 N6-isopentenylltransferase MiaA